MQLTTHFSLEEFCRSSVAERRGIDNTPSSLVVGRLRVVAEGLEKVRAALPIFNTPILVDSGYRCPELNGAVGGSKTSAHVEGWAADILVKGIPPLEAARAIQASGILFDQLIYEGSWVHISFDPRMRQEVLTATFIGGIAHYEEGIHERV